MPLTKGITGKLLLGLLLLTVVLFVSPQQAAAFSLDVDNSFSKTLYLAAVDYDENYQQWRVHGWWSVSPHSVRTIQFPNSTSKKYVYVFGFAGNTVFDGRGTPGALNYTIIEEKFEYYLPDGKCPDGKNRRTVTFMRLNIEDGYAYWQPAAG